MEQELKHQPHCNYYKFSGCRNMSCHPCNCEPEIVNADEMENGVTPQYQKDMEDAYEKGKQDARQEMAEEILHNQRKLLDGFAHPKDCERCVKN